MYVYNASIHMSENTRIQQQWFKRLLEILPKYVCVC